MQEFMVNSDKHEQCRHLCAALLHLVNKLYYILLTLLCQMKSFGSNVSNLFYYFDSSPAFLHLVFHNTCTCTYEVPHVACILLRAILYKVIFSATCNAVLAGMKY